MVSAINMSKTLLAWGTSIQKEECCPEELESDDGTLSLSNIEKNGLKASPEEVALVLKYWSSVFSADINTLRDILEDNITIKTKSNGYVQIKTKDELLNVIPLMAKQIENVEKISLEIFKKQTGALKVLFFQELVLADKSITSSGKQKWTIKDNDGTLQFSKLKVKDIIS